MRASAAAHSSAHDRIVRELESARLEAQRARAAEVEARAAEAEARARCDELQRAGPRAHAEAAPVQRYHHAAAQPPPLLPSPAFSPAFTAPSPPQQTSMPATPPRTVRGSDGSVPATPPPTAPPDVPATPPPPPSSSGAATSTPAQTAEELAELRALRSELLGARETQRAKMEQLARTEQEQQSRAVAQAQQAQALQAQAAHAKEAQRALETQAQYTQQAQLQVSHLAAQAQARAASTQAQQQAVQQGLASAGGQLVARMQALQRDVAARCEAVERNARDDVRRSSGVGTSPST